MSRLTGIEIRINEPALTAEQLTKLKSKYDVEYYARIDELVLWVHKGGKYKPFERELFQYLGALKSVYNRRAAAKGYEHTDYLDLYVEVSTEEQIGEAGEVRHKVDEEIESVKYYKNLRPADLFELDLNEIVLEREL